MTKAQSSLENSTSTSLLIISLFFVGFRALVILPFNRIFVFYAFRILLSVFRILVIWRSRFSLIRRSTVPGFWTSPVQIIFRALNVVLNRLYFTKKNFSNAILSGWGRNLEFRFQWHRSVLFTVVIATVNINSIKTC